MVDVVMRCTLGNGSDTNARRAALSRRAEGPEAKLADVVDSDSVLFRGVPDGDAVDFRADAPTPPTGMGWRRSSEPKYSVILNSRYDIGGMTKEGYS